VVLEDFILPPKLITLERFPVIQAKTTKAMLINLEFLVASGFLK